MSGREPLPFGSVEWLDAELGRVARGGGRLRYALGAGLESLAALVGHHELGFASVEAYALERCERSARWVQESRSLARRLAELPMTRAALVEGRIGFSMALVIAKEATSEDEAAWLTEADQRTVRGMRELVAERREAAGQKSAAAEEELYTLAVTVNREDAWLFECARMLVGHLAGGGIRETVEALLGEGTTVLLPHLPRESFSVFDDARADVAQRAWRSERSVTCGRRWTPLRCSAGSVRTPLCSRWTTTSCRRPEGKPPPNVACESTPKAAPQAGESGQISARLLADFERARLAARTRSRGRITLKLRLSASVARYYGWLERLFERHRPASVGERTFLSFLCCALIDSWKHTLGSQEAYAHIYGRDRHRCTSPVCDRRDVTPHHLRFRSAGGDDSEENLASLCLWCHLEGIHGGRLKARPPASRVEWRIGRTQHTVVRGRQRVRADVDSGARPSAEATQPSPERCVPRPFPRPRVPALAPKP